MYPYKLIRFPDGSGITLYEIFILIGVIAAIVLFRILADRRKMPAKLQNLVLIGAVVSFIVGYLCAVLFQAVYNAIATGEFSLGSGTGSTFYGGFIGGAVCMLLIYFVGGRILFGQKGEPYRVVSCLCKYCGCLYPFCARIRAHRLPDGRLLSRGHNGCVVRHYAVYRNRTRQIRVGKGRADSAF